MTKIKAGDRVRRVRNRNAMQKIEHFHHPVGAEFTVDSLGAVLVASADGRYCPISDCELVEQHTCPHCHQPLPEPEYVTVPEHEIPLWLTVEPEAGEKVYAAVTGKKGLLFDPVRVLHQTLFANGLLYPTRELAQARYEAIVAPTRRGEG